MLKVTVHKKSDGSRMFNEMNFTMSVLNTKSQDADDLKEYNEIMDQKWLEDEKGFKYLVVNKEDKFNAYFKGLKMDDIDMDMDSFGSDEGLVIITIYKIREYRLAKLLDK